MPLRKAWAIVTIQATLASNTLFVVAISEISVVPLVWATLWDLIIDKVIAGN